MSDVFAYALGHLYNIGKTQMAAFETSCAGCLSDCSNAFHLWILCRP